MTAVVPAAPSVSLIPLDSVERMAAAMAKSGLFGIKTPDQAFALMLVAQAEGMHPATAARDFHIINGKPALKADAMLARFLAAGGRVKWLEMHDTHCEAEFSHPAGGTVTIEWTPERVKRAGISNDMHRKYPRQMLRARCISEGIRTVFPGVAVGIYTPEEVESMEPSTSRAAEVVARVSEEYLAPVLTDALVRAAEVAAGRGVESYSAFWKAASKEDRQALREEHARLKAAATQADRMAGPVTVDNETGEVSQ